MRIQSMFRHLLVLLVFCMPLGVLGMMDPAGRDAWMGYLATDSDDDAGETTSEEEGPGVSKHGGVANVSPAVSAASTKVGWTLGISTEDLEPTPGPGASDRHGTSTFVNSPVMHGNNTNASHSPPIHVGESNKATTKPQNAGGWTLGIDLNTELAQPNQKPKPSIRILPTTDSRIVYVVQSNVGTRSQIITRATISSSTSSSQSNTEHSVSHPVAFRGDSDDEYDVAFTEGFRPLLGRGKPNKTPKSETNGAEAPTRYLPSFTGLPTGALGETQPGQNQQPARRGLNVANDAHPDQGQPRIHRFSVHIGVPLQVIIPVLACALVAGWLIKEWYDKPASVEVEADQEAQ